MRINVLRGIAVAAIVLAVAGCSSTGGDAPASPSVTASSLQPSPSGAALPALLLVSPPAEGSDMAQVEGQLLLNARGCFILQADPTRQWPLVLPHGTTPLLTDGTMRGVSLPQGVEVRVGQRLRGAGGYTTLRDGRLESGGLDACGFGVDEEFAALNAEPVTVSTPPGTPSG